MNTIREYREELKGCCMLGCIFWAALACGSCVVIMEIIIRAVVR
jgi:hypothetical protein